ncbi:MAG: diguanylate cyclase response regulator [Rhodobacterales bacterium]|nr:MAG: diguanylate cyclase response regulator [Rhodobacterales bacterium]
MPGNVLIVDDIATNRIVLKVKLATSYYQVAQSASGMEALEFARKSHPDVILCSDRLPDMDALEFTRTLRSDPLCSTIPVLVITASRSCQLRLKILESGANDILTKPLDEPLMLARLRSLLRSGETADEIRLRDGASKALGLAEPMQDFSRPGLVALVAPTRTEAIKWKTVLGPKFAHRLLPLALKDTMRQAFDDCLPDAYAIATGSTPKDHSLALRLLSDLRAHSETRDCGLLAVVSNPNGQILAEALDRGADDVMSSGCEPGELALRLNTQVQKRQRAERLRESMRDGLRAAVTDPLTGLHNRRYAMHQLARISEHASNSGQQYAVMVMDLDHFKLVNDRYGHSAGDAVLVRVAKLLSENLAPEDLVARIGGEEFLIVMPVADHRKVEFAARRLCRIIREAPIHIPGNAAPIHITVSIGVALGGTTQDSDTRRLTPPDVLENADAALYGSKSQGRNQVTFSNRTAA